MKLFEKKEDKKLILTLIRKKIRKTIENYQIWEKKCVKCYICVFCTSQTLSLVCKTGTIDNYGNFKFIVDSCHIPDFDIQF